MNRLPTFEESNAALKARAVFIKRTLGTRIAAGYLRNRGVPCHQAVFMLARG